MKNKGKGSNNFLVQGSILAAASILAKIIGLIYRVPLTNILGDKGNSYYSTANEIYSIILMISSFSLPLAVSKLMSERIHRGEIKNANRVFLCAVRFAVLSGGVLSLITYAFAGLLTKYVMNIELAKYGLRVLAPAILIFAITGTFRGFFQGLSNMMPTAVSQVIEQIINAVISVVCAAIMYQYGLDLAKEQGNDLLAPAWGAAGATFGTVASVTVALIFIMVVYSSYRKRWMRQLRSDTTKRLEPSAKIYRIIIMTILPIVLSTLIYNISNVVDQGIFNAVLKGQGYSEEQYATIWGIYVGKFRVLMNVPLSLASCLGPAIVPSLTAAMANRNKKDAVRKISSSIRFTMIFTIPCAFGMAALGGPIIQLLFHPTSGLPLSAGIMQAGALMIILYALSTLTTAILQGLSKLREPLIHNAIALVLHLICLFVLLRNFNLNIYAVIYANIFFALIVSVLNALAIKRYLSYRQEIYRTFVVPTLVSIIMAFGAYGVYHLFHLFAGNTISTIIAIAAGVVIYAVGLVSFHGITIDDMAGLPKKNLIIKVFRKLGLFR
ncbi:MAG: polysaccharide biosynthesis protein [Lachnospiraceae bacterium]|nr:polysaccharide biosynthesis protein [Lachnospiraceae bacterium]